ncbi:lung adenoma susceptibility protein 2 homolog [Sinocyclocheilus grahami]|uniref:lung adenoma susceptibility protein 2 homolog n=1 Tax=Sinocyclocheilus grahami TaxID=75366 RepID=UPI0007ACD3BB|nr:PREDICTED: lung adenoma susceptibility protein 2 homolog [Sinocyclocheilus grahami]
MRQKQKNLKLRACEDGLMSPESSVTSLLAASGLLQSSLRPEPVPSIKYRDRHYISASEALDAYITDFQRSLRDAETTTGTLELPKEITKPHPRNRDGTSAQYMQIKHNTGSMSFQIKPSLVSSCVSLCSDDKIASLTFRAEQMLNAPSFALCEPVKEHNSSGDTEDALDADRSWDNPPVTFKSPVRVGGADEPPAPGELQRSKSAASCSSGYSSRNHPGPVEALKHMLFLLQAVEHKISQSHTSGDTKTTAASAEHKISQSHASGDAKTTAASATQLERDTPEQVPQQETEETDLANVESLQRALQHLDRLKTLVDDMNERKARAEDDGTDCTDTPAANITDWARINKRL